MAASTYFALLATYQKPHVPLVDVAYLFGLSAEEAARRAPRQGLPIPVHRAGGKKSPWLVDLHRLATHLDERAREAAELHALVRGARSA